MNGLNNKGADNIWLKKTKKKQKTISNRSYRILLNEYLLWDYNNLRRKYSIAIADLSVFLFVQARDDELIQSFHFSCKI